MLCSDDRGGAPDAAAPAGEGEDFPIPPSVMAAAAAAELGFAASGNKVPLCAPPCASLSCSMHQTAWPLLADVGACSDT